MRQSDQTPIDIMLSEIDHAGTPACVGLDPVIEKIPREFHGAGGEAGAIERFGECVLRSIRGVAPVVKFQSACYERCGSAGFAALERGVTLARELGLIVILDAKRGDIGISAEHYAAAAVRMGAQWITVSPYLGMECVEPFLKAGLGVFVLVRTSNPGSDEVQSQRLVGDRSVSEYVAERVARLGGQYMGGRELSSVGAVVGATKAADAKSLRVEMPRTLFLVPGFGAQGGTIDDVRAMTTSVGGVLVTASRSVIYPGNGGKPGGTPSDAIRRAATEFADQLRAL